MSKSEHERTHCQHPDRDFKGLKCGYPLPCPYHTVVIDGGSIKIPPNKSLDKRQQRRLKRIGKVMSDDE